MSKSSIKAVIDAAIKQNGTKSITGPVLNSVLNQMVDEVPDVVNDKTTGGTTKAWSAEQGKDLSADVSQLAQEIGTNKNNITNLQQEIDSIQPIVIEGNVTNAPDEEDITTDTNDLLKFADRPTAVNQMGYVILRKNKTFAEQVTLANTIYEIRYPFDLGGASVTIPDRCILRFNGGTIDGGTVVSSNTQIDAGEYSIIFGDNLILKGVWNVDKASICWFGAVNSLATTGDPDRGTLRDIDVTTNIRKALASPFRNICFPVGCWYVTETIEIGRGVSLLLADSKTSDIEYVSDLAYANKISWAIIYTDKNVDLFSVGGAYFNKFTFDGGVLDVSECYRRNSIVYDKTAIRIDVSGGLLLDSCFINTTIRRYRNSSDPVTTILSDASKGIHIHISGATYSYATNVVIRGRIEGFNTAISSDRANDTLQNSWVTGLKIEAYLHNCATDISLLEGDGSVIGGIIQSFGIFSTDETSPYYKDNYPCIIVGCRFVTISSIFWDVNSTRGAVSTNGLAISLNYTTRGGKDSAMYFALSDENKNSLIPAGLVSGSLFLRSTSDIWSPRRLVGDDALFKEFTNYFAPTAGDKFFHTEYNLEYTFNGSEWTTGNNISGILSGEALHFVKTNGEEVLIPGYTWSNYNDLYNRADKGQIKVIYSVGKYTPTSCYQMFRDMGELLIFPIFDTSNITSFNRMFVNCAKLREIPSLNTPSLTSIDHAFDGCTKIQSIGKMDFSNVAENLSLNAMTSLTYLGGFVGYKNNLTANCDRLTFQSMMNVLTNLSASPSTGATVTFSSNAYTNNLNASQKAEVIAAANICRQNGWTVSNIPTSI